MLNITSMNEIIINEIRAPNISTYKSIMKTFCFKDLFINNLDGLIWPIRLTYHIDICGINDFDNGTIELFKNALIYAWLDARPGMDYFFISCNQTFIKFFIFLITTTNCLELISCYEQHSCLKIYIVYFKQLKTEDKVEFDEWYFYSIKLLIMKAFKF
jgi:hypothetical protein